MNKKLSEVFVENVRSEIPPECDENGNSVEIACQCPPWMGEAMDTWVEVGLFRDKPEMVRWAVFGLLKDIGNRPERYLQPDGRFPWPDKSSLVRYAIVRGLRELNWRSDTIRIRKSDFGGQAQ